MTPTTAEERTITLPTGSLLGAVLGGTFGVGVLWAGIGLLLGHHVFALSGAAGAAVAAACTLAGLLAITPWRSRPVSLWVSIWLGQTVVRLLVTPVAAFLLLYSATSLAAMPLLAAVGAAYFVAVVSEAFVVVRYLRRLGTP